MSSPDLNSQLSPSKRNADHCSLSSLQVLNIHHLLHSIPSKEFQQIYGSLLAYFQNRNLCRCFQSFLFLISFCLRCKPIMDCGECQAPKGFVIKPLLWLRCRDNFYSQSFLLFCHHVSEKDSHIDCKPRFCFVRVSDTSDIHDFSVVHFIFHFFLLSIV
jgi:hypothetical protein